VPESATLFGGLPGLVQRFDSTVGHAETDADTDVAGSIGFVQLAGYAVDNGRVLVARATCPRQRFDELSSAMRSLLASASLDRGTASPPPPASDQSPAALGDYRVGKPIAALPPQPPPGDLTKLRDHWQQTDAPARAATLGGAVLTAAELTAAARLFGQRTFPGVGPLEPAVESTLLTHARAVLQARNLVRFDSPSEVHVDDTLTAIVRQALQADLVVDATIAGAGRRRCAYFVSADTALLLTRFPDEVYSCRQIDPAAVAGDLLGFVGELPDEGDGAEVLANDTLPTSGPRLRATVRTAANDGSAVQLAATSLVAFPALGCYADGEAGNWTRVDGEGQRRHLLTALTALTAASG
jgi:hypothetical protein